MIKLATCSFCKDDPSQMEHNASKIPDLRVQCPNVEQCYDVGS